MAKRQSFLMLCARIITISNFLFFNNKILIIKAFTWSIMLKNITISNQHVLIKSCLIWRVLLLVIRLTRFRSRVSISLHSLLCLRVLLLIISLPRSRSRSRSTPLGTLWRDRTRFCILVCRTIFPFLPLFFHTIGYDTFLMIQLRKQI